MTQTSTGAVVRGASTWSILWGVLLILLGLAAIAFPLAATVAANAVIAWLIVLASGECSSVWLTWPLAST